MKYVLLIAIVLLVLRQQRTGAEPSRKAPDDAQGGAMPDAPTQIVECGCCALHLPLAESVAGQRGRYCCEAHRREAEGG